MSLAPLIRDHYLPHADAAAAEPMARYMKNHFPFLGISTPRRRELAKDFWEQYPFPTPEAVPDLVAALYAFPEREFHYTAVEIAQKSVKKQPAEFLDTAEALIVTHSWWDTVDGLSDKVVGILVKKHPALVQKMDEWAIHSTLWLRRAAILHQLTYKKATDQDRLFHYCRLNAHHTDFFIRKGMGWALRQYARAAPEAVRQFVNSTELPNLTRKEALKHLD
jgi:3-methyladenine DNA glycosylase AlkD